MSQKRRYGAGKKEQKIYPLGGELFFPCKSGQPEEKYSAAPNSKTARKPRQKTDYYFRYAHSKTRFQSILAAEKVTKPPNIFRSRAGFIFRKKSAAATEPAIPPGMNFAADEKSNPPSE